MRRLIAWLLALATAAHAGAAAQPAASTYRVGPSDVLQIKVFDEPGLSNKFTVDSDGTITYPFLGRIAVRGKTLREVEEAITTGLRADYVKNPQVTVEIAPVATLATYHLPIEGRQTASSALPSPSKSAGTGLSPETPQYWV